MYRFPSKTLPFLLLLAAACGDLPTQEGGVPGPEYKPGSPGPTYTALTPALLPDWTPFRPVRINSQHLAVGTVNPEGNPSQMAARAAVWRAGTSEPPELLPVPAGMAWSAANDANEFGLVGGHIFPTAVLWIPAGAGWSVVTLHDQGVVNGVASGGEAVGTIYDESRTYAQPVRWDAAGVMTLLPLPAGGQWVGGEALAINAQGDVAGSFRQAAPGGWYLYGALWVREGDEYLPLIMQTGPAPGLSDRIGSGQLYVTASGVRDAWRHRFTRSGAGRWSSDSVWVGGTAEGMNAAGDLVGTQRRGKFASTGSPYLFTVGGAEILLPIPKNATGTASGISSDGWITGTLNDAGVAWKRQEATP